MKMKICLQYDIESDFSSASQLSLGNNVEQRVVAGLLPSTKYYFRIKACNAEGDSDWSEHR